MTIECEVDEKLLSGVIEAGGFKSNNDAVRTNDDVINIALTEYIDFKKRQEAFDFLMQVEFDEDWTPRKARGKEPW